MGIRVDSDFFRVDPLVRVGDIIDHPKYGVGLVVGADERSRYYVRYSGDGARFVGTFIIMWSDGTLDPGWPASRLAHFVKTRRGVNI